MAMQTLDPESSTGLEIAVRPPGSKSLTNRALLLASLSRGTSVLLGALTDADDAARMIEALRTLGVGIERREDGRVIVEGVAGRFPRGGELNLNNAGTATRFLTAAACLASEPVLIDGNERMRQRPIGELLTMLRAIGVRIDELGEPGRVPIRVHPGGVRPGELRVGTTASSQYVSAIMMLGAFVEGGIELVFEGPLTSPSYVRMTAALMRRIGAGVTAWEEPVRRIAVAGGGTAPFELEIEPDASGATYFWGAGAIIPGAVVAVSGLGASSLQGDAAFVELLAQMGATIHRGERASTVAGRGTLRGIEADLSSMPDAAMTLASVACFATGPTRMRGLRTLRVKETDRIAAMQRELAKIGVRVEAFDEAGDESVEITPPDGGLDLRPFAAQAEFETYDDHRMAMSLALIGLRRPGVAIRDPRCVAKTYPTFWRDLGLLYGGGPEDA
jgi:3-phosphoshikimate 1-carboxyvinyltransferase